MDLTLAISLLMWSSKRATATATSSCSTLTSARTTTIIIDPARDGSITGVIIVSGTVFACAIQVFEFVAGILPSAVTGAGASIFPNLLSVRVSTASAFTHRATCASAFATTQKVL
ncbi:hypothetical protein glysoja_039905 [Glycine soja]|uniref:Secreted protein n=1 Tax=Glycine soja TaxID=3848 RepID=A0A0B2QBJ1_GLYSO|nr:hypothetical protein glysoja_039905 [Glycine soja]